MVAFRVNLSLLRNPLKKQVSGQKEEFILKSHRRCLVEKKKMVSLQNNSPRMNILRCKSTVTNANGSARERNGCVGTINFVAKFSQGEKTIEIGAPDLRIKCIRAFVASLQPGGKLVGKLVFHTDFANITSSMENFIALQMQELCVKIPAYCIQVYTRKVLECKSLRAREEK